jgi:hypothetical protein
MTIPSAERIIAFPCIARTAGGSGEWRATLYVALQCPSGAVPDWRVRLERRPGEAEHWIGEPVPATLPCNEAGELDAAYLRERVRVVLDHDPVVPDPGCIVRTKLVLGPRRE